MEYQETYAYEGMAWNTHVDEHVRVQVEMYMCRLNCVCMHRVPGKASTCVESYDVQAYVDAREVEEALL